MKTNHVLLIGGAGAIGSYASKELAKLGYTVDVICLEKLENTRQIHYYTQTATFSTLSSFLDGKHYAAIIDFMHYSPDEYLPYVNLLTSHAEQLIFLSSIRVYADKMHPIKETAPQLVDLYSKEEMLETCQDYPYDKSMCERIIRLSPYSNKVTIVRPVISFWHNFLSYITVKGPTLVSRAGKKPILVPVEAQNAIAGYSFSGNSGKLIAHLVGKNGAMGESFTVGKDDNQTWGEIAPMLTDALGAEFVWDSAENYLNYIYPGNIGEYYGLWHDRLLNRAIDISKVLSVTGLNREDLISVKDAINQEAEIILSNRTIYDAIISRANPVIEANMDRYFGKYPNV